MLQVNEVKRMLSDIEDFQRELEVEEGREFVLENGSKVEILENYRHNENQIVIFKINEQFYEIIGSYDSWGGVSFDCFLDYLFEVKPVQKTITVYERV